MTRGNKKKLTGKKPATRPNGRKVDPAFVRAAAEVLEAVWLSEKNFELEHKILRPLVVEFDREDQIWVTVRIHVPRLDVDMWQNRTHGDHPDNKKDDCV